MAVSKAEQMMLARRQKLLEYVVIRISSKKQAFVPGYATLFR